MDLSVMDIVGWAIFGLVIGALARAVMPGRQSMGILMTMFLGILGSFAGGFLGALLFGAGDEGLMRGAGWIMSFLGALILLFAYSRLQRA